MSRREPIGTLERLNPVLRPLLVVLLVLTALPAAAQQNAASIEVAFGLGGYTDMGSPTQISASISSPVLVAGRLRVRAADVSVSRPVEIPAGSEQSYSLTLPAMSDGSRLTVELLDGDGDVVESEVVTVRTKGQDELLVGVIGDQALGQIIDSLQVAITGTAVSSIDLAAGNPPVTGTVLDYLVIPAASGGDIDLNGWLAAAESLIVDAALASELPLSEPLPTETSGVSLATTDTGQDVIVVEGLATRGGNDLARIIRPAPLDLQASPEFGFTDDSGLVQAASEAGNRQVPALPWLLAAILAFALIVGPINFIVLSRLGKRDFAWVTIPAIALVAVGGFWVAGRQRISGTNLNHATVIVHEAVTTSRSAVIVAAGTAGERVISVDGGQTIFPERGLFGSASELQLTGDTSARVELEQLGYVGVGLASAPAQIELPTVTVDGNEVTVENTSAFDFWGWGTVSSGQSVVGTGELGSGTSATTGLAQVGAGFNEFGFNFIDSLMNQNQLWEDPLRANSLWSFGQVITTEIDANSSYFVGLTDDYTPPLTVDDGSVIGTGTTLVMVKIAEGQARDDARPQIVGLGFVNWVDPQQQVVSTDEMVVRIGRQDPATSYFLTDNQPFGQSVDVYEVWDFGAETFVAIGNGGELPASAVSPGGDVYVRMSGEDDFGDNPMSPAGLRLEVAS